MNDRQQLAAMGEHLAEQQQQPLCMAKRIEELEAQVRALTAPEGWQLVPVEPTKDMCEAGAIAPVKNRQSETTWIGDIYRAMLAAAPSPDSAK